MVQYPKNYRDNNPEAGGTFKHALTDTIFHDVRVGHLPEEVVSELSYLNEYTSTWQEALEIEREYLLMAKMNYQRLYNQRMQSTKTFIELVVTLNKDHTMEDVKKVAKMMEELYGIKMTFAAIHRDEGYYDKDTGDFIANVHAHIRFCTLDLETGKNGMSSAPKSKLIKMQTKFAEILGLKPGKKGKKQRHIPAKDYKRIAKQIDEKFREQLSDVGLDKVKGLKEFTDFVTDYIKQDTKQEFDVDKIDLTKLFKDYLDNKFKELKRLKERDERLKKLETLPYNKLATQLPEVKKLYDKGFNYYNETIALKAKISELEQAQQSYAAPVVDYSKMVNYNINVGAGAKFENVVLAGNTINVEAGAIIKNCQFNDKEPINLPKCSLSNCVIQPLPDYGVLANKSFVESYIEDDHGYLMVNGVSNRPKQQEKELKRKSSVENLEID